MAKRLFAADNALLLDQANHVPLGRAKTILEETLEKNYLGKLFTNNYGWSGVGFALLVLIVLAVLIAAAANNQNNIIGDPRHGIAVRACRS